MDGYMELFEKYLISFHQYILGYSNENDTLVLIIIGFTVYHIIRYLTKTRDNYIYNTTVPLVSSNKNEKDDKEIIEKLNKISQMITSVDKQLKTNTEEKIKEDLTLISKLKYLTNQAQIIESKIEENRVNKLEYLNTFLNSS